MTLAGPMGTTFGLLERKARFTDMNRRNDPDVDAYRFYAGYSLNDAYGDPGQSNTAGVGTAVPTLLFPVTRGRHYVSKSLRRSGRIASETHRGLTWVTFDIEDFQPGADINWYFIRQQQSRTALGGWVTMDTGEGGGAEPVYGPIYCIPTPEFFGQGHPAFTLYGKAPAVTDCVAGAVPDFNERGQDAAGNPVMPPLHIVLPSSACDMTIKNLSAATALLVSYGPGMPMISLPFGESLSLFSGATAKEVVLASAGAVLDFAINGVVALNS